MRAGPCARKRLGACLCAIRAAHTAKEALRARPWLRGSLPAGRRTSPSRVKERGKGGLFLLTCSVSRLMLPSRKTVKPCVRSVFLCVVELLASYADSHDLKLSSKVPKSHPRFTEGIFTWGIGNRTDEHCEVSGHKIIHARTFRRRHDSEKCKIEKLETLKVGPLQTETRAREEE